MKKQKALIALTIICAVAFSTLADVCACFHSNQTPEKCPGCIVYSSAVDGVDLWCIQAPDADATGCKSTGPISNYTVGGVQWTCLNGYCGNPATIILPAPVIWHG